MASDSIQEEKEVPGEFGYLESYRQRTSVISCGSRARRDASHVPPTWLWHDQETSLLYLSHPLSPLAKHLCHSAI